MYYNQSTLDAVRPLKINGLFLVQNFPKLNARAKTKQEGKKQKQRCVHLLPYLNGPFQVVFARIGEKRTCAKDQKQTIYFKRPKHKCM